MMEILKRIGFYIAFYSDGYQLVTMLTSPGNFFLMSLQLSQTFFLPNFGQNSDLGIIDYFNTVSNMYSLDKIMLEIFGQNILIDTHYD